MQCRLFTHRFNLYAYKEEEDARQPDDPANQQGKASMLLLAIVKTCQNDSITHEDPLLRMIL